MVGEKDVLILVENTCIKNRPSKFQMLANETWVVFHKKLNMSRHGVVVSFQTKYLNIFYDGYALRITILWRTQVEK
jgi:hypothetical protein